MELASLSPRRTITVFDLLPSRDCQSSLELGKLLSLLLALDSDQDPGNGITLAPVPQPASGSSWPC